MLQARHARWLVRAAVFTGGLGITAFGLSRMGAKHGEAQPPRPPPPAPPPLIIVDAGHGGQDGGTQGNGLLEKDATLDMARRVAAMLRARGLGVRMTRTGDAYVALDDRAEAAQSAHATVFVSIHLNASSARGVAGIETYYSSKRPFADSAALRKKLGVPHGVKMSDNRSAMLASNIQQHASAATKAADRGARDSRYYVVMHTSCPSVLVECGYLTNQKEAGRLRTTAYKDKLAGGIADGISAYLSALKADPRRGLVFDEPATIATAVTAKK